MSDVLSVEGLTVSFPSEAGPVRAVRGMSYSVSAGEVLGIVGESGSGKSVSALAVMGLLPRTARVDGSVRFRGDELLGLGDRELSHIRGRGIAMVFQDPLSALTPVYTVGDQIAEAISIHRDVSRDQAAKQTLELLDLVGIPEPARRARAFPHEFSGGMRQRVMIAMAMANDPDVIIADEPTTALDVTIQAQVLEVLKTAQRATGAAIVMITHDLGVIAGFADRVMVMYAGRPVESGTVDDVFYRPRMPYTLGLLGSLPRLDATRREPLTPLDGSPPSLVGLPAGCPFAPRCPLRIDVCESTEPVLAQTLDPRHTASCHRHAEIEARRMSPTDIFQAPVPGDPELAMVPRENRRTVLEVTDLERHFPLTRGMVFRRQVGTVHAVDGVSFDIREGETLGLVGESGCGKTTTIVQILSLARPSHGSVAVLGHDSATLGRGDRKSVRRNLSVVFQDPLASLDPRLPVGDILGEGLQTHGSPRPGGPAGRRAVATGRPGAGARQPLSPGLLRRPAPAHRHRQGARPGAAAGGARRAGVGARRLHPGGGDQPARGPARPPGPRLPLRRPRPLGGAAHRRPGGGHVPGPDRRDRDRGGGLRHPRHPYTEALLSAIPLPDPRRERARRRILLEGDLPSPVDVPSGCRFRARCPRYTGLAEELRVRCREEEPLPTPQGGDHAAACHYPTVPTAV